eukprot:1159175-Pelagomonas_calceolata.AAC.19
MRAVFDDWKSEEALGSFVHKQFGLFGFLSMVVNAAHGKSKMKYRTHRYSSRAAGRKMFK